MSNNNTPDNKDNLPMTAEMAREIYRQMKATKEAARANGYIIQPNVPANLQQQYLEEGQVLLEKIRQKYGDEVMTKEFKRLFECLRLRAEGVGRSDHNCTYYDTMGTLDQVEHDIFQELGYEIEEGDVGAPGECYGTYISFGK